MVPRSQTRFGWKSLVYDRLEQQLPQASESESPDVAAARIETTCSRDTLLRYAEEEGRQQQGELFITVGRDARSESNFEIEAAAFTNLRGAPPLGS